MFRSILLRSSKTLSRSSARSFASSSKISQSTASKWAVPSTIISLGLASYYLSQPLALDAKAGAEKQEKKPESDSKKEAQEAQEVQEGEAEPKQEAAYNPETGEINWDCPCLGGMAHGPCGEEFKEAFSCFVYSEAEPKGIDCVEKFKNMQNCFRKYPEIYSEEIRDEENHDHLEVESDTQYTPQESSSEVPSVTIVEETVEVPVVEVVNVEVTPSTEESN